MSQHIEQLEKFPSTRYMGSKSKLLDSIWKVSEEFEFNTVLDLFSGSGVVAAESFSVNGDEGRAYTYCPENMKYVAERVLAHARF